MTDNDRQDSIYADHGEVDISWLTHYNVRRLFTSNKQNKKGNHTTTTSTAEKNERALNRRTLISHSKRLCGVHELFILFFTPFRHLIDVHAALANE